MSPARLSAALPRAMRLLRFHGPETAGPRLGLEVEEGGDVVDLNEAEPALPRSMRAFLESGERGLAAARRRVPGVVAVFRGPEVGAGCPPRSAPPRSALASGRHRLPRAGVRLLAPIDDPEKVICVGLNYRDHCLEQDVKVPKEPLIFSKFPSAIAGPFDDIVHPAESSEVDWEVELAAIVGKAGRHIQESVAMEHIVGFTVANDVSARDWQMRRNGRQWLLGKTFDTFCPIGPAIVTKDSVTDVHNLRIRCSVNGQLMQSSSTSQLIFRLPQLVAWVSQYVALGGGGNSNILVVQVLRGTPVDISHASQQGDEVQCEIEELGTICNKVV
ncbi:hypothetical protein CIB84_004675 [Bambusicola thoracicus]|uniref:Fumarylacetoacetase-like C-terminal domain-containing protein n=1 Tax=Bambusicola thoracicus TaxID=9083 RepID=A0A2P4T5G1_BAMTH|nr:hypothetical protein CIB84_004675 [Bambusicola thoracicus]